MNLITIGKKHGVFKNMQNLDLDVHSKARIWIQEKPDLLYPVDEIITQLLETGLSQKSETRQVALEILIPVGARVCYGFLGANFTPNNSGELSLEVRTATENEAIFRESLAHKLDTVRVGLPHEYSQSVIAGVKESFSPQLLQTLGSGVICFDKAAHGEMSSSNKFFYQIAVTVMHLLLLDKISPQEQITEVVKTYSLV